MVDSFLNSSFAIYVRYNKPVSTCLWAYGRLLPAATATVRTAHIYTVHAETVA